MSTPAFAVMWTGANQQRYLIDIEGDGIVAWQHAASLAINIAESGGRSQVAVAVSDLEAIPPDAMAEARARFVRSRVLLEAMALVKEAVG